MSNGPATTIIKPTDLRGILKYVPRFQGQIFVIALDGSIVADENFSNLLIDIAVLRSLGIKLVLVHGISQQIEELSAARKIPITDSRGTGVTDAATLDLAIRASARVSHLILEGLTQNGLKCAITNAVRSVPVGIIKGLDQQFTGRVDRIDKEFILHLIAADIVPILSPIGFAPDGHSLRINSDLLAAEFAEVLQASKIIYLPIDYFKRKDSIINHSDFLQRCNLIAVHCSRLTDLLKPYCERIEFIEHYDKYVLPNPVDYNPKGMVLWIGQCAYFERVRDWYASEDLHESRSFRLNVLTNRIKKMSLNLRSHPSISLDTWTEKLQRYYFENARAGLDLKGNSFHQQTKPPIKIQQFVASGIPAMVNCSSYSWEYFHERGFNLADPDDTDRWLSRAYWKETRAFVPKLRPAISKANVIQSYLNLIEKA